MTLHVKGTLDNSVRAAQKKVHDMKLVKTYDNNMALYYLALFSKPQRAYEFWKDVLKYGTDQWALWD